jgi:hypothetical protein
MLKRGSAADMKMDNNKKIALRLGCALLAIVLAAALLPQLGTKANAATSLKHIEEIKKTYKTLQILELVPQAGKGSIGYYIAGQEPTANWRSEVSKLGAVTDAEGNVTKTGTQARTEYVGAMVNSLRTRGLLNTDASDSGNYPLSYTADYKELYPWSDSIPEGYTQLQLKDAENNIRYEAASVKGDFAYSAGAGTFSAVNGSAIFKPGKDGGYVQNVDYFLYGQPDSSDTAAYYYYSPSFSTKINIPADKSAEIEQYAGKALYQQATGTNTDGTTYTYMKYVGTVGLDYRMLTDTDYYTSTGSGDDVSAAYDDEHPYRAIANAAQPFKPVTTGGYFDVPVDSYMYVGTGGDYIFTPSSASSEKTLLYNYIYVTGGYTNNNWFLKYVFDMTDEDIKNTQLTVKVYSIVPSASNENTIISLLDTVDMTSVSAGFSLGTGGQADDYSVDITANELNAIESARKDKNRAVLIDSRLSNSAMPNVKKLSDDLMLNTSDDAAAYGFVSGSLYYYVPYSVEGGSSFAAIATKDFNQKFASSLSTDDSDPFYEVKSNIVYTNFLRDKSGITNDDLSLDISMAACIRHIINYYDQISVYTKDSLRVLDIEPLTQLTDETQSKKLTKTTVESWLPDGCAIKANEKYPDNITITTWSTAEFISRINDINDDFDLVYVGSSLDNFSLNSDGTAPEYNDSDMDGLIYSNIGDEQKEENNVRNKYVGLVDSDYTSKNVADLSKSSNTYRLSGNDITKIKSEELKNFASSGLPIVVADNLINAPKEEIPACVFSVTASVGNVIKTNSGYTVDLTATPAVDAGTVPANITYAWSYSSNGAYFQSVPGAGKSKTLTYSTSAPEGYYYCTATTTYTRDGVQYNATCTSNKVYLSANRIGISLTVSKGNGTLTASVPSSISQYSVRWYRLDYSYYNQLYYWNFIGRGTNVSIDRGEKYMCRVISSGTSYYSQQVTPTWNGSGNGGRSLNPSDISGKYYVYDAGYYNDEYYYYSETISTYKNWSTQSYNDSVSVTIPKQNAVSTASVNSSTVDCNSIMYTTLDSVVGKANVMTATQAYDNKATLIKYVNLSKPNIVFAADSDKPTEYTDLSQISGGTSLISGNTLEYTFTITNPTDPTPYTTEYTCGLYIDLNADGRYGADEEISDLAVTSTDESTGTTKTADGTHLKQGVQYTVMRELPHKYSGIIPWCLKVTQNDTDGQVRTSYKGYTFAMPQERTKIKILQITSKSGIDGSTFSLKYYHGISTSGRTTQENYYLTDFLDLYNKNLYDITMDTVSVSDLNDNSKFASQKAVEDKFFQYNMLILGFGDGYGWMETGRGLQENAAKALVTFIKSGQAVLFTHDTTSFVNLPSNYATSDGSRCEYSANNDWYWGYYFNDVIRDSVGLDRYGVTNEEFGVSRYSYLYNSSSTSPYAGYVAGGYSDASVNFSEAAKQLTSKDYSIAYKPQKDPAADTQQLSETQGYTNQQLLNSGGGHTEIKSISQVNKGQITTYPYNINTTEFEGKMSSFDVGTTHEQYYQLNMNSDEIVVWYCLSGAFSTNYKNDGTNAYYIYNRGNVTYSGAGHDPTKTTEYEAKLFVNTMIAAYRAAATPPDISFKAADGTTNLTSQILPVTFADESSTGSAAGTATENSRVYFRVNDTNLVSNKTVTAKFYYYDGSRTLIKDESDALTGGTKTPEDYGFKALPVDIYSASTGAKVYDSTSQTWSPKSLNSSTLYYLVLPDDIAATASPGVTLLGMADTTVVQQTKTLHYLGIAAMNLQKLGYRLLR